MSINYKSPTARLPYLLLLFAMHVNAGTSEFYVPLKDSNELLVVEFGKPSDTLLLWWPSINMPAETQTALANQFVDGRFYVWISNPIESRFLPDTNSSYQKIPDSDVIALIETAKHKGVKRLFIYAEGSGATPVLQSAHQWQIDNPTSHLLGGVIFNSPMFYQETPDPGELGELMPIVKVSNLPIYILQPDLSPRYWQLKSVLPVLQENGSDVFVHILKNMRGRYHFRPDAEPQELDETQQLAHRLNTAVRMLNALPPTTRQLRPLTEPNPAVREGKKDRLLAPYNGDPSPPHLELRNLHGDNVNLEHLKTKVVLVNFWTTWCPPCVHEMPSMQRLADHFKNKAFVVLGVNMAENRETIDTFLANKVKVTFPILLDENGDTLQRWRVHAFPTSFIVDKHGKIRYALFGSIDWDTPEVIGLIEKLIRE